VALLLTYLRVIKLLGAERGLAIALVAGNLFVAGVLLFEPWLFGQIVDTLTTQGPRAVWMKIAVWAIVGFIGVLGNMQVSLHADKLAHRRRLAVTVHFFERAISRPLSYHAKRHSGEVLRVLHRGSNSLFNIWIGFFKGHLATLLSLLVVLPLAFVMNWKLAVTLIAPLVIFAISNAVITRRTERAQREIEHLDYASAVHASDVLANVNVVQSFTRVSEEVATLEQLQQRALEAQLPVLTGWAWISVGERAAGTLSVVAILGLGALLNARGEASVGDIVSFVGFAGLLISRLESFARFFTVVCFQIPALEAFFAVLDAPPAARITQRPLRLGRIVGEVEFRDVTFSYEGSSPAVRQLSFRARPGMTVALVGPTGAGKTTALSLLCRIHDADSGVITVDGHDIRTIEIGSLRQQIAMVFQQPGLLYRTIAENVLVGKPGATEQQIEAAARAAEAHDFIMEKPAGYATPIAERGCSLSGGEQQRLAIARALLKDAAILVLDEAMSALDSATELRVQRAIEQLRARRTTFVIAHRLTTVRNADLILVLDEGRLVQQGRFAELVAREGLFRDLAIQGKFARDGEGVW
jgi:glucan exporter ATP-binding protein